MSNMPDPGTLSSELFTAVLRAATLPPTSSDGQWSTETLNTYYACSLVSHTWHVHTLPLMYENIHYDGEDQPFKRMWLYTRTLIENPSIGLLVQHATFWHCYLDELPDNPGEDARSDRSGRRESRAICSLGCEIGFGAADLSRALQAKKRFPLMAIIISKLPNLVTLSLNITDSDRYHHELDKVLAVPGSFPRLRDVVITLLPGSLIGGNDFYPVYSRTGLCHTPRVIFSKQSVRKLVINNAYFQNWQELDAFEAQQVSNVTHLSITPSFGSYEVYRYLPRILQLPRLLISLNLSLEFLYEMEGDDRHRMPSCHEIWKSLGLYEACLEHFSFYRTAIPLPKPTINDHVHHGSQMGSLKSFRQLQSLSIPPEVLLGYSSDREGTQEQLKDKLPNSLVSLTLHADESLASDASLERQMIDVVTSSSFPKFKRLCIQDCNVKRWEWVPVEAVAEVDRTGLLGQEVDEVGADATNIIDYRKSSLPSLCEDRSIHFKVKRGRVSPEGSDTDE